MSVWARLSTAALFVVVLWPTQAVFGQFTELASFDTPTPFDSPVGLVVNRENQVGTVWGPLNQPYVFLYGAAAGVQQQPVTNETDRVSSFDFGDWGTVLNVNHAGGAPSTIDAAALGQPFASIALPPGIPTSTGVINDAGTVGAPTFMWTPASGTESLLPALGANALGPEPLIDSQSRIVVSAEFLTPTFRVDAYRYTPGIGWENLTETLADNVTQVGQNGSVINAGGDFTFLSGQGRVNLFNTGTGAIVDLGVFTKADGAPSFIETDLADTGEALVAAGRNLDFDPFRGYYRQADGTEVDLASLLPTGFSFPIIPEIDMNHLGDLLFEAKNDATGKSSFFVYDGAGPVAPVPTLQDLEFRLQFATLSDDGQVYFWQPRGEQSILGVAAVPEPSALVLALLGLGGCLLAWRRVS